MSNFNGRHGKGYMKTVRELKREEAGARNAAYRASLAETAEILADPETMAAIAEGDAS